MNKVLCKSLEPPLILKYFASKEPDCNFSSSLNWKVLQAFSRSFKVSLWCFFNHFQPISLYLTYEPFKGKKESSSKAEPLLFLFIDNLEGGKNNFKLYLWAFLMSLCSKNTSFVSLTLNKSRQNAKDNKVWLV